MTRNLSTILAALAVAARVARRAPADAAKRFTIRGAGFGHGVGMSQYGAMGYASHGWDYKRILAHYYTGTALGVLDDAARGARAAAVDERLGVVLGRDRAPAGAGARRRPRPTACAAAPAAQVQLLSPRGRVARDGRRAAARDRARPADAARAAPATGARTAPTAARSSSAPARSAAINAINAVGGRRLRPGRRPARVAVLVADRGAQGAGRRGAHVRAHDVQGRRRLRPLPRHALAGLRRRGRRGGVDERGRRRRPPASSSPTTARRCATYFFSTSGGRTEDVENTSLGTTPQPWLQVGRGRVRQRLAAPPLGPDPDDATRSARAKLGGARARALQGHQGDHARRARRGSSPPTSSARAGARASTARRCARASACTTRGRTSRRSRRARRRSRCRRTTATAAARRPWSRARRRSPALAGRVVPARARDAPIAVQRRVGGTLDHGRHGHRRRGGRYRYGITAPGSTACATRATRAPSVPRSAPSGATPPRRRGRSSRRRRRACRRPRPRT